MWAGQDIKSVVLTPHAYTVTLEPPCWLAGTWGLESCANWLAVYPNIAVVPSYRFAVAARALLNFPHTFHIHFLRDGVERFCV